MRKLQVSDIQFYYCCDFLFNDTYTRRREKSESGDIDMLITHPKYHSTHAKHNDRLKRIVATLEKSGLIIDKLSLGETKFMVLYRISKFFTY